MYNPNALFELRKSLSKLKKSPGISEEFTFRINHFYQDLHTAFHKIYGDQDGADKHLHDLLKAIAIKFKERPDWLKTKDAEREQNPDWYLGNQIAGMMLYVDRFAGDLKSLEEKLPYFEDLSVNLLHLMPLMKSPKEKNDGGYAVSDYLAVDKRLGSTKALQQLCKSLHEKDMLIMLDLVVNHTSDEHAWATRAMKGSEKYQDYYYTFPDRTIPDLYEQSLPEVFPENAPGNFTWNEEMQRWVMTVFNTYQWDLNYRNPKVFIEMLNVLLTQANWGVDMFRLDAVAFLWKQMGTSSQNLDRAHDILQLFKVCTQIVAPGVVFLAEAIVAPHEIMKYFGKSNTWSNECDLAYNATLMAALWDAMATRNNRVLTQAIHGVPRKPDGTSWINYIRCHDDIGLGYEDQYITNSGYTPKPHRSFMVRFLTGDFEGSFSSGEPFMVNPATGDARISGSLASLAGLEKALTDGSEEERMLALNRIVLLQAIVIAWEGIPMLYYGDELATLNDYSYADNPEQADDNRWIHRPRIDWENIDKIKDPSTEEGYVFQNVRKLLRLRRSHHVFADNQSIETLDTGNEHTLAFARSSGDEKFLMIANLSDAEQLVPVSFLYYLRMERHVMRDLVNEKNPRYEEGQMVLAPYQFYWFYQK